MFLKALKKKKKKIQSLVILTCSSIIAPSEVKAQDPWIHNNFSMMFNT